eukprot:sb/3471238/
MLTKSGIIFASLFVIGSSIMCEQCDEAYINYWNGSAEEQPYYSRCDVGKEVYCEKICASGYYKIGISGHNTPDLPIVTIESGRIRGCGGDLVRNRVAEFPEYLKLNADIFEGFDKDCSYADFCNAMSGAGSLTATAALILSAVTVTIFINAFQTIKRLDLRFLEIKGRSVYLLKGDPEFPGISGQVV